MMYIFYIVPHLRSGIILYPRSLGCTQGYIV